MKLIPKPLEGEYTPYAIMYIDLLPDDGQVLRHLEDNLESMKVLARSFPETRLAWSFAEGEWTIKEILVHVIDDERIYAYRALRFARGDTTELPGFEQDDYVPYSHAHERGLENILDEYSAVRFSTIALFSSLDESAYTRSGIANGHVMSVRAALYHLAGHELHHMNSIRHNYLEQRP